MDLGLKGKVALVAAASKGLGRAVAEELAAEGCKVVICARDSAVLDQTAKEISAQHSAQVLPVMADVSESAGIRAVFATAIAKFGAIDIVVTNAGGPPSGKFEDIALEEWERAFHLTLMSAVELVYLALPAMKERKWGRILNITSIAAKQPVDNLILSNSLRAAVTGFARTLANEVAPFGVTVNNLLPGYTLTDRVEQLTRASASKEGVEVSEVLARWEAQIPMKRLGEPREFAALAAFLASERASYITGQSIGIDGGWIRSLL
ncbi:MAG: SDR family oxidoreductase [Gemmatimonadaceae bacterium]|nr:SDR family oxidoreductase [Gemmatimonadaceae bacterium]